MVGVLRPDFHLPSGNQLGPLNRFAAHADIFKPMGFDWPKLWRLGQFNFACLIRLRPARILFGRRATWRQPLTFILSAVMVVLLIVCLNLGNLMLVRANERSRDAAIRRALGAPAGDLLRAVMRRMC